MTPEAERTIQLPAAPGSLDTVLDLLREIATDARVDNSDALRIESAVMEVVENVIEHGVPAGASKISVRAAVRDGWFRTEVHDDGPPVTVDLTQVKMPTELAEGGRGLAIAATLLDEFGYERQERGNLWRLGLVLSGA